MTETETILTNKPWFNRVISCFCAFLICCLVCFCGFAIPKVKAQSVVDDWEDYIDYMYGEGAFNAAQTVVEAAPGIGSIIAGVMTGLEFIQVMDSGKSVQLNDISSVTGRTKYDNKYYYTNTTLASGEYYASDGNIMLAKSELFDVDYHFTADQNFSVSTGMSTTGTRVTCHFQIVLGAVQNYTRDIRSNFFANNYSASGNGNPTMDVWWDYGGSTTIDPTRDVQYYFRVSSYATRHFIAQWDSTDSYFNWGSELGAIGITANIQPDNFLDWVLDEFNPVVEEEFPEFHPYLFYPTETPTETTILGGCCCHVDVYVEPTIIVEPTINVYVNPWELPSYEQDYTLPTTPAHETIPFPTQDSSNTEPVTMPTMDLEEFQQTYKNAFDFWFYCAEQLIEKMNLQILLAFVFVVTVVGFIMWKLGG